MKKLIGIITAAAASLSLFVLTLCGAASYLMPDEFSLGPDSTMQCGGFPLSLDCPEAPASSDISGEINASGKMMLFGVVPVKDVRLCFTERKTVTLGGEPFGIRIYTDGLVVAGTASVPTVRGSVSPAENAGISPGDIIISANGEKLSTNEQLVRAVELSGGNAVSLRWLSEGKEHSGYVTPVMDNRLKSYRIGLLVRDSCAGIGTVTFRDEERGVFAGLGHGIYDSESGSLMPLLKGDIVRARISSVDKSSGGHPGTLIGSLDSSEVIGTIISNDECGIYGTLNSCSYSGEAVPVAFRQEVLLSEAKLLTTINDKPEYYSVMIEDINYNNGNSTKSMVIHITDSRLLDSTGGIVQGMSGSPIIQNGRLIGAVTHVFVDDPSRGYAIFAENMLEHSSACSR